MIEITPILSPQGVPWVSQRLAHPSVYLDTWAIREFAENPALGDRFRKALFAAGGTVVLSALTLADFVGMDDPRHARAAGEFIDSLIPRLFLSRFEPFEVRNREYAVMSGTTKESPFGDEEFLLRFASPSVFQGRPLSAQAYFAEVHQHRAGLRASRQKLAAAVVSGIEALRARAEDEPGVRADIRRPMRDADRPRATHVLMRLLFAELEAEDAPLKNPNNAIDLFQCIAPAAYCTYILIDGAWQIRIARAKARIESEGFKPKVATPFSKRDGGVDLFLCALESQPSCNTFAAAG